MGNLFSFSYRESYKYNHIKSSYFLVFISCCIVFQETDVLAAWKNLCPDHLSCPSRTIDYPEPGNISGDNKGITLSYDTAVQSGEISHLLIHSDRIEIPAWSTQGRSGGTFMQHSGGNWIGVTHATLIHTLDETGKELHVFNYGDLFMPSSRIIAGPILESKGTVYFSLNNLVFGTATLFSSTDAGLSWRKSDALPSSIWADEYLTEASSLKLSADALYPNPFGPGFYYFGRDINDDIRSSPKLFQVITTDDGQASTTRIDDLQPVTDFDARLKSITFDYKPENLQYPVVYAATDKGIYTSHDKGRSWYPLEGLAEPVSNLAIAYNHQPKLIVASTVNSGVLVSRDKGKTWQPFASGLVDGETFLGFSTRPFRPAKIYYQSNQLLARTQGGWYRCSDFDCEGTATIAPPVSKRGTVSVVEFYNSLLDHYFMTSEPGEITAIETGQAGPNWSRTGFTFTAWTPLGLNGGKAVCRFYGSLSPGPNSHFFSASADECDQLHRLQNATPDDQPRWNFEGLPFMVAKGQVADANACTEGHIPIYRAYNNGYARGMDSNHRFVADKAEIDTLVAKGWADEGIAFCALP